MILFFQFSTLTFNFFGAFTNYVLNTVKYFLENEQRILDAFELDSLQVYFKAHCQNGK